MIELIPIAGSSQIASAGYDPAAQVLSVLFHRAKHRYDYQGVPPEVYEDFQKAESKGAFVGAKIKGTFDFEKIALTDKSDES